MLFRYGLGWVLAFSAVTALCVAPGPAEPPSVAPADKQAWVEARSAHFTFYSCASEDSLRDIVRNLETLHAFMQKLYPDKGTGSPKPFKRTLVYVFKHDNLFQDYRERSDVRGWFVSTPEANYLALPVAKDETQRVVFHEYTHNYLNTRFPVVPVWLGEGIAEFYSTLRANDSKVVLGAVAMGRYWTLLRSGPIPMESFLAMDNPLHGQGKSEEADRYYAQAWLLAHHLILGKHKERYGQLQDFLRYLGEDLPQAEAFKKAFPLTPEALGQEFQAYLDWIQERQGIPVQVVDFDRMGVDGTFTVSPLTKDRVHARLGLLAMRVVERKALARQHFQAALAINPGCPEAQYGMGNLLVASNAEAAGFEHLIMAAEILEEDAELHLQVGSHLFQKAALGRDLDVVLLAKARKHLLRHKQLEPGKSPSFELLRQAIILDPACVARERSLLEAAWKAQPARWDYAALLASLSLEQKDIQGALPLLRVVAEQGEDPEAAREAREQTGEIEDRSGAEGLQKGLRWIREGKPSEAVPVLSQALAESKGADLRLRIRALLKMAELQTVQLRESSSKGTGRKSAPGKSR